jgi:hypothetical protein
MFILLRLNFIQPIYEVYTYFFILVYYLFENKIFIFVFSIYGNHPLKVIFQLQLSKVDIRCFDISYTLPLFSFKLIYSIEPFVLEKVTKQINTKCKKLIFFSFFYHFNPS